MNVHELYENLQEWQARLIQLKASQSLGEDPNTKLYGGIQYQFGIPKPRMPDFRRHQKRRGRR